MTKNLITPETLEEGQLVYVKLGKLLLICEVVVSWGDCAIVQNEKRGYTGMVSREDVYIVPNSQLVSLEV